MSTTKAITNEFLGKVYNVLVEYGASTDSLDKFDFCNYFMEWASKRNHAEYRFCGIFGMGGKCRLDTFHSCPVHCDYYPECRTPELDAAMKELNDKIKAAWEAC